MSNTMEGRSEETTQGAGRPQGALHALSPQRRRAFVADDEPLVREFVAETLRRSGFAVELASDGREAATRLLAEEFDLALLDLRMPGAGGLELLASLTRAGLSTPVVLMTAYASVDAAINALRLGARDFVTKPFTADDLEVIAVRAVESGRLAHENRRLRVDLRTGGGLDAFLGESSLVRDLKGTVAALARSRATVLVTGESGTGKELVARALHAHSPRADQPFIQINCAALPEGLLESELFGHEKGSFTGAFARQPGKFELADGGTILLDEIGDVGAGLQPKLLRVLQEREFYRVGGKDALRVDVRVVASTNVDLEAAVEAGRFRRDLFYRLNVVPLRVPALRERKEDILLLARHFIRKTAFENGLVVEGLSAQALERLEAWDWPGNVRELINVIERAVILCRGRIVEADDLQIQDPLRDTAPAAGLLPADLGGAERHLILEALRAEGFNRTRAAVRLGISIRTLRNKLKAYGVPAGTPGVKRAA